MEAGHDRSSPSSPLGFSGLLSPSYHRDRDDTIHSSNSSPIPCSQHSHSSSCPRHQPDVDRGCPRSLSFEDPSWKRSQKNTSPRHCGCSKRAHSLRSFARNTTGDSDESMLDSVFDDDFLPEERPFRPCWRTLHAIFLLTYSSRKRRPNGKFNPLAGHADNFRTEDGYVLKALTLNEANIMESLQRDKALKPFAPQFMGCVEREGRTFIKMQDVLLSMSEPNFMDVKMGLRTFAESEVKSDKRRIDLLKKALLIQQKNPAVYITDDEKENGISKYRFMSVRDHASSSATLGFRVQGMMKDQKALNSKDFSAHRSAIVCRTLFRSFFERASPEQRTGLLQRLKDLHTAASNSDWFSKHEVIGSSLLIGYDTANPAKFGIWMIDFARTEQSPTLVTHIRPWTLGSREDGYLLGVKSLIKIWSDEFQGDIPLDPADWHYRAEGHECIVIGYHGVDMSLQGKVLRLAKKVSTKRHQDTLAGHPAAAYNEFVSTMLTDYLGPAADAGQVVHVDRPFLEAMAGKVEKLRPGFRVQQSCLDLDSQYQLLLEDGSYVAGAKHGETIAVELKLKMGYLPPPGNGCHWLKSIVSRFAMQQHLKVKQGQMGRVSGYCPLDLFSGDFDRMQNVLSRLLDSPQNNLRVFLGDVQVVPQEEGKASSIQSGKGELDCKLEAVLGSTTLSPSMYLCELLAKCLLQPCGPSDLPLIKKVQNLQRIGLDIETLWPRLKGNVKELQQLYHVDPLDVTTVAKSLPSLPPLYCHSKQQRLRRGLRNTGVKQLHTAYHMVQAQRKIEAQKLEERVKDFDEITETRKFLLSQSIKACSLMVALACVTPEGVLAEDIDIIEGSDGRLWRFSMRLLDLDAKNIDQLEKWYTLDQAILRAFQQELFGPDEDFEALQPPSSPALEPLPPPIITAEFVEPEPTIEPPMLDSDEVDRILASSPGEFSPCSSSCMHSAEWEVEEMLNGPERLPSFTDQQIEDILGLCPASSSHAIDTHLSNGPMF